MENLGTLFKYGWIKPGHTELFCDPTLMDLEDFVEISIPTVHESLEHSITHKHYGHVGGACIWDSERVAAR